MREPRSGQRPRPPGGKGRPRDERGVTGRAGSPVHGTRSPPARRKGVEPDSEADRPRRAYTPAPPSGRPTAPMRIAKAVARAGLCSRREAERWIADGRVKVNGRVIASPALDVGPADTVIVDGRPLPDSEPVQLWRYHKPKGLVTTHADPEGRPTVFERLPPEMGRVISVGRLDFNTEGLLLLTNDGALARHLELPATGWLRRYRVRAHGRVTQADLDHLKGGIEVEGVHYGPIEATLEKAQGANVWLGIGLREGKNREVRNILRTLQLDVNRLIRVSFGPFQLLDLEPGTAEAIKRRVLADQLSMEIAKELGLIDGPRDKAAGRAKGAAGRAKTAATDDQR